MFGASKPTRRARARIHRSIDFGWDDIYTQDASSTRSFSSHLRTPTGSPFDDPTPAAYHRFLEPSALNSRVKALIRRYNALTACVGHLVVIVQPPRTMKQDDVTDEHIFDMKQEASNIWHAMQELGAQMAGVEIILDKLKKEKEEEAKRDLGRVGDRKRGRNGFHYK